MDWIKTNRLQAIVLVALACIAVPAFGQGQSPAPRLNDPPAKAPHLIPYPIQSVQRLALAESYSLAHYGSSTAMLRDPAMIVIHFTATPSLKYSLETFKPYLLPAARGDIGGHGDLNVGVHFVVAKNGDVYSLLPEDAMGRHAIGFNWCALGIELVALDESELTEAQLTSCAALVAWIAGRNPSIRYLIGHHEYMDRALPHFALFIEKDPAYAPTYKTDPGAVFMDRLRRLLYDGYRLHFAD